MSQRSVHTAGGRTRFLATLGDGCAVGTNSLPQAALSISIGMCTPGDPDGGGRIAISSAVSGLPQKMLRDMQGRRYADKQKDLWVLMHHSMLDTIKKRETLATDVREMSLKCLNLGKAFNPLRAAGIMTIGDLINLAGKGFGNLGNFGRVAHYDVINNLHSLGNGIQNDGTVDWSIYAQGLGIPIVFQDPVANWQPKNFISSLAKLCETVIPVQLESRNWTIFKKRLLMAPHDRPTLEEIGAVFQLTRERVRQLQEQAIDVLRSPLTAHEHQGLKFRIRPEIGVPIRQATTHFESIALPAWLRSRWVDELAQVWGWKLLIFSDIICFWEKFCHMKKYDQIMSS